MKIFKCLVILATMVVSGPVFATIEEEPRAEHFEEGSGIVVSRMRSIDELGEPTGEFQKADYDKDGNNVGYFSGGDAPTLFFEMSTPPLFDRENKPITIVSFDVEVTLKDGFVKTALTNTLEINPYSETAA